MERVYIIYETCHSEDEGTRIADLLEVHSSKIDMFKSLEKFKRDYPRDSFDYKSMVIEC